MAFWGHVDGIRITSGSITIPRHGAWTADLVLADESEHGAQSTLVAGDLELRGVAVRSRGFAGDRRLRMVGGAGGWMKTLKPRAYHNAAGLRLSMLLGDAAIEVGETVSIANDVTVGEYFVREAAPAQRLLRQLAGLGWWIDGAGVTQVRPRPTGPIKSEFTLINFDGATSKAIIATDALANWMPGRSFSTSTLPDAQTISMVRMKLAGDGKLRLEVLCGGDDDREDHAFRQRVRAEFPQLTFLALQEYVVQKITPAAPLTPATTIEASPVTNADILPGLVDVPLYPSILGEEVAPTVGSKVLVAFIGGDPTRPIVVFGDPKSQPTSARLLGGIQNAARVADKVSAGPFAGVILPNLSKVKIG